MSAGSVRKAMKNESDQIFLARWTSRADPAPRERWQNSAKIFLPERETFFVDGRISRVRDAIVEGIQHFQSF